MKILIYISQKTEFNFLLPLIQKLIKDSIPLFFLIDFKFTDLSNVQTFAESNKIEFFSLNKPAELKRDLFLENENISTKKISFIKWVYLGIWKIAKPFIYARYLRNQFKFYIQFLKENKIEAVVLGQEVFENQSRIIAHAAKEFRINCFIIPFVNTNRKIRFSELKQNSTNCKFLDFSKWTLRIDKDVRFRLKPGEIISWYISGMHHYNPWVYNSGYSSKILLKDKHAYDFYINEGFNSKKLEITGSPMDDSIFDGQRNRKKSIEKVNDKYFKTINKPIILISIPNYFELKEGLDSGINSWEDLVNCFLSTINGEDYNILLNPHPRLNPQLLNHWQSKSIAIADELAIELIPVCYLYLVSISNLIELAAKCHIPVINFDYLNYNYRQYEFYDKVFTVNSKKEFENSVKWVLGSDQFNKIEGYSNYFDGKAINRIIKLISKS